MVYTCSPARHLSWRYEVVPACGKVNRNTVPQGLLAAAHNRPPWEFMSSPMGTRQAAPEQPAASLCSVRHRRDAFAALGGGDANEFPVDRRCLHRGAADCPRPKGVRLHHRRPCHRRRACRHWRRPASTTATTASAGGGTQVAATQASIDNIDAQLNVQQAQISVRHYARTRGRSLAPRRRTNSPRP